jgi:hypothetical protein
VAARPRRVNNQVVRAFTEAPSTVKIILQGRKLQVRSLRCISDNACTAFVSLDLLLDNLACTTQPSSHHNAGSRSPTMLHSALYKHKSWCQS